MPLIEFSWTSEKLYRRLFRTVLLASRSTAALSPSNGLPNLFLSPDYQKVVERTVVNLPAEVRQAIYPTGLRWVESCALLAVADGLAFAHLSTSLFLHQCRLPWIDEEGREFEVETVFAAFGTKILVTTEHEFPLGEDYLIDRQLFRTEVAHLVTRTRLGSNPNSEGE